jgi:spore maturation protein CgeB
VDSFRPDAIVIFSGDIQDETFDHFHGRIKTALLLDDYFPIEAPVTRYIKRVDVFFHTMTGQLEEYRAAGTRHAVYLHSGVDPDWHVRSTPSRAFASDVAFVGGAVYPDRIDLIKTLHKEVDLKIYGSGWRKFDIQPARDRIAVKDFSRVCASAKIIVGIDKAADRELYFSNRTWFVLGCGGFLLTRYIPGLERIFANHKHMVWYRDSEEALDQIRFYLKNDAFRKRIASTGHDYVHTHYPFDRMASNMVDVLFHDRAPRPLTDPGPSLQRGATDHAATIASC